MKYLKYSLFFLILMNFKIEIKAQDTAFILRNLNKRFYQAIFIDKNTDWKYFKNLKQINFFAYDSISYQLSIAEELKHSKQKMKHSQLDSSFPKVWYQLNKYEKGLYLYDPNDNGFNTNKVISDSCFINFNMDGPYPILIDSMQYKHQTFLHLYSKSNYAAGDNKISIYILDWDKKIALFDYHNPYKENRYRLMVAAETSNLFSVVVNYSRFNKCQEYHFETIDFKPYLVQLGLEN